MSTGHNNHRKLTAAGALLALGIVFGDIGTSPLYVMRAIIGGEPIAPDLVLGGVSAVFWTLTFQTTLKYVILTLRADNRGEGGILSLYALVRRKAKWLTIPAIIGASTLLADGIITPPISVTSAIEGLQILNPNIQVVPIVISILMGLFLFQRYGTKTVGTLFGPVMILWFLMLGVLGVRGILLNPSILAAFNPKYVVGLLSHPGGFWLLGAVFLCTTGAEALYSDMGHVGRGNIRGAWVMVKTSLLLNYMGQGGWLLSHQGELLNDVNPFYALVPAHLILPAVIVSTAATIIASQALISGSYTLIAEAIRLNLWPKMQINYPTEQRGQVYLPAINMILFVGCVFITLYFQKSSKMEAAYGLAITLTMLMTTLLLSFYLRTLKVKGFLGWLGLSIFFIIEMSFLIANLDKFAHGGYVTVAVSAVIFAVMWVWFNARKIKNRYVEFTNLKDQLNLITELSEDESIPKFATNLVFLTSANHVEQIETKIMYSLLNKNPKRADVYFFVHIDVLDSPYTQDYKVFTLVPQKIFKIEFRLGFKVEPKVSILLRKVVADLSKNGEVNIMSRYTSLEKHNIVGDFRFVAIDRIFTFDPNLSAYEKYLMSMYKTLDHMNLTEVRAFGLDTSLVTLEKVPLVTQTGNTFTDKLRRIGEEEHSEVAAPTPKAIENSMG